jgi:hypothetical protein
MEEAGGTDSVNCEDVIFGLGTNGSVSNLHATVSSVGTNWEYVADLNSPLF